MTLSRHLPLSAARENMRRLAWIRTIALIGQLAGVCFAYGYLEADISYRVLLGVIAVLAVVNGLTMVRLKQDWLVTDAEYFAQLLCDVAGLTLLLYFAGGSTNPFISYYLVILTICAATLPWRYTWSMAGLTFGAYSVMLFSYQPLMSDVQGMDDTPHGIGDTGHGSFFSMHVVGMWLSFFISALLITYFVVKMAQAIRQQDADLAAGRETTLHDEQLFAVATLAAGTAHELGTPLSTMAVVVREMQHDYADDAALQEELTLLENQLQACKHSIQRLVGKSTVDALEKHTIQPVDSYINQLIERWRLMRPEVQSGYRLEQTSRVPCLRVAETLSQAIMNLLNNAGDASPQQIEIDVSWDEHSMLLSIRDFGEGIAPALAEKLGKPFVSTKRKGLGLGLFLSHATVVRFDGSLALYNHHQGGTLTELRLPICSSQMDQVEMING